MKVVITKELEDWWGIDDLIESMPKATKKEREEAIIELLLEDVASLIEDATWRIIK